MLSNRKNKTALAADRYVARLFSAELTDSDEQEIEAWRAASPEKAKAFEASMVTWSSVEGLANDADLLAESNKSHPPVEPRIVKPKFSMIGLAAGILLVVTIGALSLFLGVWERDSSLLRLTTEVGERHTRTLSDGSVVTLNTDTALIADFSAERRRMILDRGEVFFDVNPDSERPFSVEVGSKSITVVGTQFSVQSVVGRDLTVAVLEGSVALHRREDLLLPSMDMPTLDAASQLSVMPDQYRVQAGTVLTLKETSPILAVSQENVESFSEWRNGIVRFDGAPLYEVVREINRYTDQHIVVDDPQIMNLEVSAVLRLDQIETVFVGLESTLPIKLTRTTGQIVIQGDESTLDNSHQ